MSSIPEFDVSRSVKAEEIRWKSNPLPRLEDRSVEDLMGLSYEDLVLYAYELQGDLRNIRGLWHDTLAALARTAEQRDRAVFSLRALRRAA